MATITPDTLADSTDERSIELYTLTSIYPELTLHIPFSFSIQLPIDPISAVPTFFTAAENFDHIDVQGYYLSHFPPITLKFTLPESYPANSPPDVEIETPLDWIPGEKIGEIKDAIEELWREYGEVTWAAINYVSELSEQLFDLVEFTGEEQISLRTVLRLPPELEDGMVKWNERREMEIFEKGSYECEPKPGTLCHKIRSCAHAFCRPCLTAYFTSAITRGEIASIVCSDPGCVKLATTKYRQQQQQLQHLDPHPNGNPTPPDSPSDTPASKPPKNFLPPTLPPEELAQIPLSPEIVERYISLKKMEALRVDPDTTYCPRPWCQAPSRESLKAHHEAMRKSHSTYFLPDLEVTPRIDPPGNVRGNEEEEEEERGGVEGEAGRLNVCSNERCAYAFCVKCRECWHGDMAACRVIKDGVVISPEELATEEYLRSNTAPCPSCSARTIKSHGCNHMVCKCGTHYCFLCSAYLSGENPYTHFNTGDSPCYGKLWEGEQGDQEELERRWGVGGVGYMQMMGMAVAIEEIEEEM